MVFRSVNRRFKKRAFFLDNIFINGFVIQVVAMAINTIMANIVGDNTPNSYPILF